MLCVYLLTSWFVTLLLATHIACHIAGHVACQMADHMACHMAYHMACHVEDHLACHVTSSFSCYFDRLFGCLQESTTTRPITWHRDKERSPFLLVLQTPSKSFRHCSLPRVMCGVFWEVKSMSWIFVYGGKLFLHLYKLEWFKSKQIRVDENLFICSQELFRAVSFDRDLATIVCVQRPNSST